MLLRRSLQSIQEDGKWLEGVFPQLQGYHIVSNQRCGLWYHPQEMTKTCYFKSTDGHPQALQKAQMFGLRRLNFHLLCPSIHQNYRGLLIIDSTKNPSKPHPDSFTRTIPVWAWLMNSLISRLQEKSNSCSFQMHESISTEEVSATSQYLPAMLSELETRLGVHDPTYRIDIILDELKQFNKRIRLYWVDRSNLPQFLTETIPDHIFPIVLVNPSVPVLQSPPFPDYIRGAGDDEETWAMRLTPSVFWKHCDQILSWTDEEMEDQLAALLAEEKIIRTRDDHQSLVALGQTGIYVNQPVETERNIPSLSCTMIDFSVRSEEWTPSWESMKVVDYESIPLLHFKKDRHGLERALHRIVSQSETSLRQSRSLVMWSNSEWEVGMAVTLIEHKEVSNLPGFEYTYIGNDNRSMYDSNHYMHNDNHYNV